MWLTIKSWLRKLFGLTPSDYTSEFDEGFQYAWDALADGTETIEMLNIQTFGSPEAFDRGVQAAIRAYRN